MQNKREHKHMCSNLTHCLPFLSAPFSLLITLETLWGQGLISSFIFFFCPCLTFTSVLIMQSWSTKGNQSKLSPESPSCDRLIHMGRCQWEWLPDGSLAQHMASVRPEVEVVFGDHSE